MNAESLVKSESMRIYGMAFHFHTNNHVRTHTRIQRKDRHTNETKKTINDESYGIKISCVYNFENSIFSETHSDISTTAIAKHTIETMMKMALVIDSAQ